MKLTAVIDLDNLWGDGDYETTIGRMVCDELKIVVQKEIKKAISNDPNLIKGIEKVKNLAVKKMLENL